MRLSAVILTKNEQGRISHCVEKLKFCDEIVVIDDYSTDNTVNKARSLGCRVFRRHLNGDFAAQRNDGLKKTRGQWVLFIDADEIVTKKLAREIDSAITTHDFSGYRLIRHDIFNSKELRFGEWSTDHMRLVRKGRARWVRMVHETCEVDGETGKLVTPLLHYSHVSVGEFVNSIHNYASLHALANYSEGKYSSFTKILLFPPAKFVVNYFVKQGFRDGIEGFIYAMLMSFHSFLAWSELWLYQQNQQK